MAMALLILVINVVYISLLTVRTMFTLKGKKVQAAMISAVEAFVFVLGIGLVLENLEEIQNLIAYAGGFAIGVLVGTKIEQALALGYVTVKVISKDCNFSTPNFLRQKGFGVTSWHGEGRGGARQVMEILTSRKDQQDLYNYIMACDPEAFVISYEPQHFRGGFWVSNLRRYCKKHGKSRDFPFDDHFPEVDEEVVEEIQKEEGIIPTEEGIETEPGTNCASGNNGFNGSSNLNQ